MNDRLHRSTLRLTAAGLALACAGAAPTTGTASPAMPEPLSLRRLVAACSISMATNVCSVAKSTPVAGSARVSQAPVFVVGAGAVDRTAYAYLQDGGKAMCARAQSACGADWSGAVCATARRLWAD